MRNGVELPPRMQRLPRDARGYPIPYAVERDAAGKPLFIVNDSERSGICIRRKLCTICGERLTKELWYVGGPQSALHPHGAFLDSAMHHECMTYALQVCPYLAMGLAAATDAVIDKIQDRLSQSGLNEGAMEVLVDPTINMHQPEVFAAVMSYGRTLLPRPMRQNPYSRPLRPYHEVEFWRHGQRLGFREGLSIIEKHRELDLSALRLVAAREGVPMGATIKKLTH